MAIVGFDTLGSVGVENIMPTARRVLEAVAIATPLDPVMSDTRIPTPGTDAGVLSHLGNELLLKDVHAIGTGHVPVLSQIPYHLGVGQRCKTLCKALAELVIRSAAGLLSRAVLAGNAALVGTKAIRVDLAFGAFGVLFEPDPSRREG